jgi:DNA polymerase elongation subunit (family B)
VEKYAKDKSDQQIVEMLSKISKEKVEPFMAKKYEELAQKMNAFKQAMHMKRENIGDKAIWQAKKRYMMNVWDSEGIRYETPELKMMGIETARSSTPEICRKALEESIRIIMNKNEAALWEYVDKFKEKFLKSTFDDVAFPRTANNLTKYQDVASVYKKATPIHVKGSLLYNKLLQDRGIKNLSPIFEGEKIKFAYLKQPNPIRDTVIAAPGYLPFIDLESYIDYQLQFEKTFLEPLNHILELIGWNHKETESLEALFG